MPRCKGKTFSDGLLLLLDGGYFGSCREWFKRWESDWTCDKVLVWTKPVQVFKFEESNRYPL